jgi:hypothetical protein
MPKIKDLNHEGHEEARSKTKKRIQKVIILLARQLACLPAYIIPVFSFWILTALVFIFSVFSVVRLFS